MVLSLLSGARRHVGVFGLALVSPLMAYLLDLRFAQLVGPQEWLDEFRTLQVPLVAALMASTVLFPQVVMPKAAKAGLTGLVDWNFIKRVQAQVLLALGIAALILIVWPEWFARALSARPVASLPLLVAAIRPFGLGILVTLAGGLNASCLMAAGNDAWLYTIATGPTLGALCCLEILGGGSRLFSISMFTLAGALLLYAATFGALLNRYLRRQKQTLDGITPRFRIFGMQDLQLTGVLVANHLSAIVLNRILTQDSDGTVSIFSFALKIMSVVTLPAIVLANRLLAVLPTVGPGSSDRARVAGRSAVLCLAYSLVIVAVVILSGDGLVHVVFFKAKFSYWQTEQIRLTLRALVFGLPALVQGFIWMRLNTMDNLTQFTFAGACGTLAFSWLVCTFHPHMAVPQAAMIWSTGMSLQSAVLLSVEPMRRLQAVLLNLHRRPCHAHLEGVALTLLTGSTSAAAAALINASEYNGVGVLLLCNIFCVLKIWTTVPPSICFSRVHDRN